MIKKYIALTLLFFSFSALGFAQEKISQEFRGGRVEIAEDFVKLKKWDGESVITIASPMKTALVKTDGENRWKQTSKNQAVEVEVYELAPAVGMENGGIEYQFVLNEKPSTNAFSLEISTEELVWLYQGELDPDEAYQYLEDHPNGPGVYQVLHRPENVVGSYAVYHSSKYGGEYKSGKAFHVFRPKIYDANGDWVWGEFNTDVQRTGVLTVTVPQDFLDNAAYPVIVDPTFGDTDGGASCQTWTESAGSKFTLSENGDVTELMAKTCECVGVAQNLRLGIYNDSSGVPDSLVVCGASEQIIGSSCSNCNNAIYNDSTPSTTSLVAGTYWLGITTSGGYCRQITYDTGSANSGYTGNATGGCSNPADDDSLNDRIYSIYAQYTATGGVSRRVFLCL